MTLSTNGINQTGISSDAYSDSTATTLVTDGLDNVLSDVESRWGDFKIGDVVAEFVFNNITQTSTFTLKIKKDNNTFTNLNAFTSGDGLVNVFEGVTTPSGNNNYYIIDVNGDIDDNDIIELTNIQLPGIPGVPGEAGTSGSSGSSGTSGSSGSSGTSGSSGAAGTSGSSGSSGTSGSSGSSGTSGSSGSATITNNTDNYLLSATGTDTINGEANLTFDGAILTQNLEFERRTSEVTVNDGAEGNLVSVPTANYLGLVLDYTLLGNDGRARFGTVRAIFDSSSIVIDEVTSTDLNNSTDDIIFTASTGTNAAISITNQAGSGYNVTVKSFTNLIER